MNGKNEFLRKGCRWALAAILFFSFQLSAYNPVQAQVKWHTINQAATAKIGERLYFVDFYTSWCKYCIKMDRETFTDPTVAKILNKYYYPVKFNAESGDAFTWHGKSYGPSQTRGSKTHQFAQGLQGFPSFALFKADGTPLQVIPGFYPPDQFIVVLWYFASGDCDRYPFERYMQLFDKEIRPQMNKALSL